MPEHVKTTSAAPAVCAGLGALALMFWALGLALLTDLASTRRKQAIKNRPRRICAAGLNFKPEFSCPGWSG
jgi:hypothetical protein